MKKESRISQQIRDGIKKDFGTILHKVHGGAFSETGAADLYGTLPNGRAIYIETKAPGAGKTSARAKYQKAWLLREAKLGAVTMFAPKDYAEVRDCLIKLGYVSAFHIPLNKFTPPILPHYERPNYA